MRSWSERLMRIDGILDDEALMMDMGGAIMEFAEPARPSGRGRRAAPQDDLVSIWANAELGGCPMEQSVMVQETGLFISGGAETTRTVVARGLIELTRHPETVGGDGGRPRADPGRGRGADPLGDAAQQLLPHRDA